MYSRPRDTPPVVLFFWGDTGLGKSRTAYNIAKRLGRVYKVMQPKGSGIYFDGYDGDEVIWLDEFYGNRMSWGMLLEMTDRYPNRLPVHGSQGPENMAKYIIFTSNTEPSKLYDPKINPAPFLRRISLLYEFRVPEPTVQTWRAPRATKANFYVSPLRSKSESSVTKLAKQMAAPVMSWTSDPVELERRRLMELRDNATYVDEDGKVRIRGG